MQQIQERNDHQGPLRSEKKLLRRFTSNADVAKESG
jgi:hypothetical protein